MSSNTNTDIWIAGAFAAFTVDVLVYPLDTLKTRIQSPDYKKLFLNHGTDTVNRRALFRGLYQGITSVVLATLPSCMLFSIPSHPVSPLITFSSSSWSILHNLRSSKTLRPQPQHKWLHSNPCHPLARLRHCRAGLMRHSHSS